MNVAVSAVDGGSKQIIVVTTDCYRSPLIDGSGIIDICEAVAPIERIIADARHAVGDGYAREAGAIK